MEDMEIKNETSIVLEDIYHTHDNNIATQSDRIISMIDGRIDEKHRKSRKKLILNRR